MLLLLVACEQPDALKNTGDATVPPADLPGDRVTVPPASAPPGARDMGAPVPTPSPRFDITPAPGSKRIPSAFHGEWNLDPAACGTGLNDSRLVIEASRLRFYESVGDVERVWSSGPGEVTATARFSGEGETWTSNERFSLSSDGRTLTQKPFDLAPPLVRQRCPAEPNGGPAHSGRQG